uniref:Putative dolichyl-phosphate beta-glucosyltransferase n=1 Tax=Ixodes ricinus TaxID=34613 RepID=V5ICD4_IXORI
MAERSILRTFLMFGLPLAGVAVLPFGGVRDTQCGFKLFSREAAAVPVPPHLHVERWAFDVEMLYIAQRLKFPIREVAVHWTEIEGSKVVPFWSWLEMGRDLFLIWLRYTIGAWAIAVRPDKVK